MSTDEELELIKEELKNIKCDFDTNCERRSVLHDKRLDKEVKDLEDEVKRLDLKVDRANDLNNKIAGGLLTLLVLSVGWASLKFDNLSTLKEAIVLNGANIKNNGENIEKLVKSVDNIRVIVSQPKYFLKDRILNGEIK